jgi:hypothetical protein
MIDDKNNGGTEMENYRMDNTQGYTQNQLDELNRRYESQIDSEMDDDEKQNVSEKILREFDTM